MKTMINLTQKIKNLLFLNRKGDDDSFDNPFLIY